MTAFRPRRTAAPRVKPSGFTVLEMLVVIAVMSLLIGLLLPALSAARESARAAKCLANLRELARTSAMYMDNEDAPSQPWHLGWNAAGANYSLVSEFVFGGVQTNVAHPDFGVDTDMFMLPTYARPYNAYIAPGLCEGPIPVYSCPSDRMLTTINQANPCAEPKERPNSSSSITQGNSYAINWHWYESAVFDEDRDYSDITKFSNAGRQMLRMKVGGPATKFVIFMESVMNTFVYHARPKDGSQGESCYEGFGTGWHRQRSRYTMAMLDGHAEYRYVDSRFSGDEVFELWPEKGTQGGL